MSSRKQLLLLDDVFSALDRHTKKRVATKLLGSDGILLRLNTTVVYTTHDSMFSDGTYQCNLVNVVTETIAALADEVYEIDEDGSLKRTTIDSTEEEESQ